MNGMTQIKTQRDKWDKILLARKSQERNERKEKKPNADMTYVFGLTERISFYIIFHTNNSL